MLHIHSSIIRGMDTVPLETTLPHAVRPSKRIKKKSWLFIPNVTSVCWRLFVPFNSDRNCRGVE